MNEYREHALKAREAIRQLKRGARIRRDRMRVAICEVALIGKVSMRTFLRIPSAEREIFMDEFYSTLCPKQRAIEDCLQLISERGCG